MFFIKFCLVLLLTIGLNIVVAQLFGETETKLESEVSKDKLITNMSEEIQTVMDLSVNPCENFYQYACGNFEKVHPIPMEKLSYSISDIAMDRLSSLKEEFFHQAIDTGESVASAEYKVRQLYGSCMNPSQRNETGVEPIYELIDSLGGWHALNQSWDEEEFDWIETVGELRRYDISALIGLSVGPDVKNPDKNVIKLYEDSTGMILPRSDPFSNSIKLDLYKEYIKTILLLTGIPPDVASETSMDIFKFTVLLSNITIYDDHVYDLKDHFETLTIHELQNRNPEIEWTRLFKIVFNRSLPCDEVVNIITKPYFYRLPKLLAKTSKRTIANYIYWKVLLSSLELVDGRYDKITKEFRQTVYGSTQLGEPEEQCRTLAASLIREPIESYMVRKYWNTDNKKEALEIGEAVRRSFRTLISKKDWLEEQTKYKILRKLDAMVFQIGYLDENIRVKDVDERYKNVSIQSDNYFQSVVSAIRNEVAIKFNRIGKETEENRIDSMVKAYYDRGSNKVAVSAGYLQPPYYHELFPIAINFGALGAVIGRETTRAFDKHGQKFDSRVSVKTMWTNYSTEAFDQHASCFVDQYNEYSYQNISLRGETTETENIADTSGIRLAYDAFINAFESTSQKRPLNLTGANFNDKQLFFLSYAHTFCSAQRAEIKLRDLENGAYSPPEFRVRGSLSNMEEFSEAFNCPLGSNMNPENKCIIW